MKLIADDIICNITIYADDTTLYSKCDQAFDLWQQIDLTFELESDIQNPVNWGKKWLVDFNAGKTQVVQIGGSNNTGSIDLKMDESVLEEKLSFQMVELTFSSKLLLQALTVSLLLKVLPIKFKP